MFKKNVTLNNSYFALRHGQSEANVQGVIVSDPAVGCIKYGLTETGREQVRKSVLECQTLDSKTVIFSSDFCRARETAEIAAGIFKVEENVIFAEELRERDFGKFNLKKSEKYELVWEADGEGKECDSVETPSFVFQRLFNLICRIEEDYSGKKILLVSHGDAIQILAAGMEGIHPCRHREIQHFQTGEIRLLSKRNHIDRLNQDQCYQN
ncbi:histidine phosphatase family protein [bacterium]|nr:histidine phosphatase family protein [bacterium]